MTIRKLPAAPSAGLLLPLVRSEISGRAEQRWNEGVRAAADEESSISILGVIGSDFWDEGVTAKRISAALRAIGPRDVVVNINSPGGDVFEGLAIYSLLREHKGHVTVKVLGLAASAASVIAMAADDLLIARAGFLMIHNTWVGAAGDRHALREAADLLEPFDAALADIYAARSGVSAAEISAMLDKETWMGGSEAIAAGFADGLLSSDAVAEDEQPQASALRRLDAALAKSGMPRSERRRLCNQLFAKPGAGDEGMPRAAETEADGLSALRVLAAQMSLFRA